jgi:hypothetical protein
MKYSLLGLLAFVALGLCALTAATQPPPGKDKGGKKGPPPKFEPGTVLPPFLRDALELTEDQEKQLRDLEKEVRARLEKILTPEQLNRLQEFKGGPPDKKGPPDRDKKGPPEDRKGPPDKQPAAGGAIQYFATWDSGLAEAQRTGKPIFLVSAAPHCAGVCGIW